MFNKCMNTCTHVYHSCCVDAYVFMSLLWLKLESGRFHHYIVAMTKKIWMLGDVAMGVMFRAGAR